MLCFSVTLPDIKAEIAAGTKVSDRIIEATSAKITVSAIGLNIFPSTPVKVKIGKYTIVIIITPKRLGLITSVALSKVVSRRSVKESFLPNNICWLAKFLMQFSTTITAPSTIKPKSSAPKLIRLALILLSTIPVIVINIANGITRAVINAALKLPRNKNNITITKSAPSRRLFLTVLIVALTRSVRL